jgi:glycosyltransferase involved in cell wall biosynthesis
MKAFFIVPQITHYRISFYEKIIKEIPQYNWLIIDGEKKVNDGRPTLYKKFSFPTKRFTEVTSFIGPFTKRKYEGLFEFVKTENPDLIIMPTIVGTSTYFKIAKWGKETKKEVILWSCLWEQESVSKSLLRYLKDFSLRRFLKMASKHIAYSTYAKNKLINYQIDSKLIHIAYNGLDIEDMTKNHIDEVEIFQKKKIMDIGNKKVLLYVGGLGPDKKVDLLIKAFALFNKKNPNHNILVLVIGDGPEKESLIKLSEELGIDHRINFLGRIVENVDLYFQLCDCYILPGCGGLGLNQAMYWEKPCIVSHADGTEEDLITDGITGFRFKRSSIEDLEEAIARFESADKKYLESMGKNAKKIIENESNVDNMVRVFKSVIEKL